MKIVFDPQGLHSLQNAPHFDAMGDLNSNFCRPNGPVFPAEGKMTRCPAKHDGWVSHTHMALGFLRWETIRQDGSGS